MTSERYVRAVELFQAACDLDPNSRADFLSDACNADDDLRRTIKSMLEADEKCGLFLDESPYDVAADLLAAVKLTRPQPTRIGHYRIVRVLGEGGMGVVYEAEQDQPRRTVALKIIKPGFVHPQALRRFEQEFEALGRLQHPGIARVYEASTTGEDFGSQPYFAMELIRGDSLLQHAGGHRLAIRQKLALMTEIAEAVDHAHQRGIIHRDLKPGNILVDDTGHPKILDLGVARVTNSEMQITRETSLGQLVGTLAYMSPEQVLADGTELDARSDVYTLGLILYELLAGRPAYKISAQLHEAVRTIREDDPVPLSSINRMFRGDIETIVAKALEKDRTRRYSSAAELAADLHHYVRDEPIAARQPSAAYQLKKFARRHKALVTGLASVFAVLILGIIVASWQATRARRAEQAALVARDRAEAAEKLATAVNDFLRNDLLAQASPSTQAQPNTRPERNMTVRTALDRAAVRIKGKFAKQPLIEASIRQTIGNTYEDLGLYPEAQQQVQSALELRRRVLGDTHPDTLSSMHALAGQYWRQGRFDAAEQLYMKVLTTRRRTLGENHLDTLNSMHYLGIAYLDHGRYAQAKPLFEQTYKKRLIVLGERHPDTLMVMEDLATLQSIEGRFAQAESLFAKVVSGQHSLLGADHPDLLLTMNNLAALYRDEGKYVAAETLYKNTLDGRKRVLGAEHPYTLGSQYSLAGLYRITGRYARAEALYAEELSIEKRVQGEDNTDTAATMSCLGEVYLAQGTKRKYAQAEAILRKALGVLRRHSIAGWLPYHTESLLGQSIAAQGRYTTAETLLLSGYQGMLRERGSMPSSERAALAHGGDAIIRFYEGCGKAREAREWRRRMAELK